MDIDRGSSTEEIVFSGIVALSLQSFRKEAWVSPTPFLDIGLGLKIFNFKEGNEYR
mgnify:CR=1 FL=1